MASRQLYRVLDDRLPVFNLSEVYRNPSRAATSPKHTLSCLLADTETVGKIRVPYQNLKEDAHR